MKIGNRVYFVVSGGKEWYLQEVLMGRVVREVEEIKAVEIKVKGDEVTWIVNEERVFQYAYEARARADRLTDEGLMCYYTLSDLSRTRYHVTKERNDELVC